jgi:hypothetical protein
MKRASPTSSGKLTSGHWREDLFADLLQSIRLCSTVYFRTELRAPWGLTLSARGAAFHIGCRRECGWNLFGAISGTMKLSDQAATSTS